MRRGVLKSSGSVVSVDRPDAAFRPIPSPIPEEPREEDNATGKHATSTSSKADLDQNKVENKTISGKSKDSQEEKASVTKDDAGNADKDKADKEKAEKEKQEKEKQEKENADKAKGESSKISATEATVKPSQENQSTAEKPKEPAQVPVVQAETKLRGKSKATGRIVGGWL